MSMTVFTQSTGYQATAARYNMCVLILRAGAGFEKAFTGFTGSISLCLPAQLPHGLSNSSKSSVSVQ